jgi:hypothetical protein
MLCNLAIAVPNIIRVIRLSDVGRSEPSDVSSVAWLQWRGGELATFENRHASRYATIV